MILKKIKKFILEEMKNLKQEITEINTPINSRVGKVFVTLLGILLFIEKRVLAAPSTGYKELDVPATRLLSVFQAIVFWISVFYTLKALLMWLVKGEGSAKQVGIGAMVCIGTYVIPWIFGMIPGLFGL